MLKLKPLICELLSERMSYEELMNSSTPERKDRATRIPAKSLAVRSTNDREAWKFSYKTPKNESTTGVRHQGFIYFYKENIQSGDNVMKIDCSTDCSCPDYKYRFSYANKQQNAGENGPNSLNRGLNYPSVINRGPGLCKHLLCLKEYLRTNIESEPVQPTEPIKPVPASPSKDKKPPEEPEEVPIDRTETPDIEEPKSPEIEEPKEDPTQTPEGPDQTEEPSPEGEEDKPNEDKPEEEPLKENRFDGNKIAKALDEFCRKYPLFIIQ